MDKEFSENAFIEIHKFIVAHNLTYIYFIIAFVSCLIFLLGWIISARKSNAEIQEIKSKTREIDIELADKIYVKFLLPFAQKVSVFNTLFSELKERISEKDKNGVLHFWDKVSFSFNEMVQSILPYLSYEKNANTDELEKKDFVIGVY